MKKRYWLLRPLPHGTDHMENFLKNDFIAVGYPVGGSFKDCSYNDIRHILKENKMEEGLGNVHILVKDMNIGDIVIVPSTNKKDIFFAEIASDYHYAKEVDLNEEGLGYPHQRMVNWLLNKTAILRSDLPDDLRSSLRYPGAVAELTKHAIVIEQLIFGIPHNNIENFETQAKDIIKEALESKDEIVRLKAAELILKFKL